MTLVVPCLDNTFMVLLSFGHELAKIGLMKPIFWILVPLEGRLCVWALLLLHNLYTTFK